MRNALRLVIISICRVKFLLTESLLNSDSVDKKSG